MSVPPSDGPAPVGRRRIVMSPGRVLTPIALIAREGEERDVLENQIAETRPVVAFPSLAHFITDSTRKERWAGVILSRTHAWDSRLDDYVARRAFIALYALEDEGYGWPDAVRRFSDAEGLKTWLSLIASPDLPEDDKPRAVRTPTRPRKERLPRISIALAPVRATVSDHGAQLALPIQGDEASGGEGAAQAPGSANQGRTIRRIMTPSSAPKDAPSTSAPVAAPKRRGRPPKLRPLDEQLSFEATAPKRRGRPPKQAAQDVPASPSSVKPASGKPASGKPANHEAAIAALAYELGFARAAELLELVRQRAHDAAR